MTDSDSLIKARYAMTILKTARACDRPTATKLIDALARDFPAQETSDLVAGAHRKALVKFDELADALRSGRDAGHLWHPAERATLQWIDVIDRT